MVDTAKMVVSQSCTPCLKKLCIIFSEHRQISTNFDNFWQKDSKEAKIVQDALIFHLT